MADSKFLVSAAFIAAFVPGALGQSSVTTTTSTSTSSASSSTATSSSSSSSSSSASSTSSVSSTSATSTRSTTSTSAVTSTTATTSATSTGTASNTLPTLSTTSVSSVNYPGPSVPPTSEAPFMHRSSARDGTVFIAVGAILGTFALAVLLWRAIVACMLHRSVERAARAQAIANDKASYPLAPQAPFYKYTDRDSSASLGGYGPNSGHDSASAAAAAGIVGPTASGRGMRKSTRSNIPSSTPSMSNLFYSPTAAPSAGVNTNRNSTFLPAGFYASASPAPPVGTNIGMSNLRPESRGNGNTGSVYMRDSPDGSPHLGPTGGRRDISSSTVNLTADQRAPSAYLEDLLDENPNMFPPQGHQGSERHDGHF